MSANSSHNAGEVINKSSNHIKIEFSPTKKQHEAWMILQDKITNVLYYGGAASWAGEKHT